MEKEMIFPSFSGMGVPLTSWSFSLSRREAALLLGMGRETVLFSVRPVAVVKQ